MATDIGALAKDLSKKPPRSPRERIANFAVLPRAIDKCRAEINGTLGEYSFNCPLDQNLFEWKQVNGEQLKEVVQQGCSDEEIGEWLKKQGAQKSDDDIRAWSDQMEASSLYDDPEKREWFSEECRKLGLDPASTSLFSWLEADDRASFQ